MNATFNYIKNICWTMRLYSSEGYSVQAEAMNWLRASAGKGVRVIETPYNISRC